MDCSEVRPELSELVDGDLSRDARAKVEAHLAGCAGCRRTLEGLRRTKEMARALPRMTAPESAWLRIRADFEAQHGRAKRLPFPAAAAKPADEADTSAGAAAAPRRFAPRRRTVLAGLAAAAIVVLGVSAGIYLMARRAQPAAPPTAAPAAATAATEPTPSVEAELTSAEQHYQNAIAGLEKAAKQGQGVLDPQTAAVLQKNMGVVDQAISQSRAALRSEPTNEAAQSTLFEALQRKVGLLRDTISLINEMRKGDAAGTAGVLGTLGKS